MSSTAEKRRALAQFAAERDGRMGRMLRRTLVIVGLLALIAPVILWAGGFFSVPAAVAEVRRLVDEQVEEYARVARGEVPFASAPSSAAVFERFRELPREQREQAGRELGRLWQAHEHAELRSYFLLPPQARQAELDRRIKAEEERRRQWDEARARREQERARGDQQATTAGGRDGDGRSAGPAPAVRTTGGGGPPRVASDEARLQGMKRRLDRTTPEERALRAEYRRAMEARREQLGLPIGGSRRGG